MRESAGIWRTGWTRIFPKGFRINGGIAPVTRNAGEAEINGLSHGRAAATLGRPTEWGLSVAYRFGN